MRDFRTYARAQAVLGEGLTVVHGANGAGKSTLLAALYFGCTGRSPRTRNDREFVRFGAQATRVVVQLRDAAGAHEPSVASHSGGPVTQGVERVARGGGEADPLADA